jgi:hypothetical protein
MYASEVANFYNAAFVNRDRRIGPCTPSHFHTQGQKPSHADSHRYLDTHMIITFSFGYLEP